MTLNIDIRLNKDLFIEMFDEPLPPFELNVLVYIKCKIMSLKFTQISLF